MGWIESLQKVVPWVAGLPLSPKIAISTIAVGITFLFLLLVWTPSPKPAQAQEVVQAFNRMKRVLASVSRSRDGTIVAGGVVVLERHKDSYVHYVSISEHLRAHPDDIDAAYEKIWEHGGPGRVYSTDAQPFEAVVRAFFKAYEAAKDR